MSNRLAHAASAYLRSAAHQPIHWYAWGSEPFAAARAENRPVLLDIGAVWCHWCHVMDGESYEDPGIAELLNEHYVCIKVDRDERPDVDARYQRAVQAITGQSGWPLTAFLTSEGGVFYGGTYFPPDGKYGRPGFHSVLEQIRTVYARDRSRVEAQADTLRRALADHLDEAAPGDLEPDLLAEAAQRMARLFDFRNGGFGTEPKFPHPAAVTFLFGRWRDTGEDWARDMAQRTLAAMQRGGIHDQLGGGFHRYSVDARWIVPHFEKMSYDNAELLKAYLDGHAALGEDGFAETARGIVRWVREVLADPEGGYGASQDADVGLEDDGDYFTWTLDEAREAIGDLGAFEVASAYYDIGTAGEMQHDPARNVLFVAEPLAAVASQLGISVETATERLRVAEERLRKARALRDTPSVDRARYTSWNAMLAAACIRAGGQLNDAWALGHGLRTLARIRAEAPDPAALPHSPAGIGGLLDDQVQTALASIDAYEATGDHAWLEWSRALLDRVWAEYHDSERGGLFDTPARVGEGLLPIRIKSIQDTPTPSANGVAALAAARLAELTGDSIWAARRDALVRAFAGAAVPLGLYGATLLQALDWSLSPPTHFVIVSGRDPVERTLADELHRLALQTFAPRRVVQRVDPGGAVGRLPSAVQAMLDTAQGTRAFACVGAACLAPATTLEGWRETLTRLTGVR